MQVRRYFLICLGAYFDWISTGRSGVPWRVFGARLVKVRAGLAKQYQPLIAGRAAHISFVTEAELRFGARWASWGEARLHRLEALLASADVVLPGAELIDAYGFEDGARRGLALGV